MVWDMFPAFNRHKQKVYKHITKKRWMCRIHMKNITSSWVWRDGSWVWRDGSWVWRDGSWDGRDGSWDGRDVLISRTWESQCLAQFWLTWVHVRDFH